MTCDMYLRNHSELMKGSHDFKLDGTAILDLEQGFKHKFTDASYTDMMHHPLIFDLILWWLSFTTTPHLLI